MGFFEAVSQVIRKSFVFKGRARRKEYWSWALFGALLNIAVAIVVMMITSSSAVQTLVSTILGLLMFFPGISVAVRRLHDVDRSGWWIGGCYIIPLVYFALAAIGSGSMKLVAILSIPFIFGLVFLGILLLIWDFTEGTQGPNKYGEDPKRD